MEKYRFSSPPKLEKGADSGGFKADAPPASSVRAKVVDGIAAGGKWASAEKAVSCTPRRGRPRIVVPPDELRMMTYLRQVAPGPRSAAVISTADLGAALGFSRGKARKVLADAQRDGLVEAEERFGADGGCLANAYRLTRKGRRQLAAAEPEAAGAEPEPADGSSD